MASVRLRFIRQADVVSSLIAWFSAGPVSHVGAILPDGSELGARSDHAGGKPAGVQIRPGDYAKFAYQAVFEIPCSETQGFRFWEFMKAQIGKPYDRSAILGFVTGRNWRDQSAWICSELVAAALEAAQIVPPLYLIANKITPTACALLVSAIGAKTLEETK